MNEIRRCQEVRMIHASITCGSGAKRLPSELMRVFARREQSEDQCKNPEFV